MTLDLRADDKRGPSSEWLYVDIQRLGWLG